MIVVYNHLHYTTTPHYTPLYSTIPIVAYALTPLYNQFSTHHRAPFPLLRERNKLVFARPPRPKPARRAPPPIFSVRPPSLLYLFPLTSLPSLGFIFPLPLPLPFLLYLSYFTLPSPLPPPPPPLPFPSLLGFTSPFKLYSPSGSTSPLRFPFSEVQLPLWVFLLWVQLPH